jgi:hypothetical protein
MQRRWALVTHIVMPLALVVGVVWGMLVLADKMLATTGSPQCADPQTGDIRTGPRPTWRLTVDPNTKLLLALDHQIKDARRDKLSVRVAAVDDATKTTGPAEVPVRNPVGARLTATPRASEPLAFTVITDAALSDDGQGIEVQACTVRPNRDTKPGRYAAMIRVGGTGIVPVEVPVEVTIRAGVRSTLLIALLATILSLALTHYGTPVPTASGRNKGGEPAKGSRSVTLILAVVTGLIGGLAAAYLAYDGDPTWGAQRGKDTVNLVIAAAAAASAAMSAAGAGAKAFKALGPKSN